VRVTARIDGNRKVFRNESCRVTSTLLGDASLQFFLASDKPGEPVQEGDSLKGIAAPDPLVLISEMQTNLSTAIGSVSRTSDDLGKVVQRVGGMLEKNESRIQNILVQADEGLKVMRTALDNANDVIGDPQVRAELRKAMSELPSLFNETRQTVTKVRESFDLVERNLKNVENFTRPLGQHGEALVQRIDGTLQNLDTLVTEFTKFSRSLNSPEGSLGKLIHDPELYNHVSRTVARLDEITQDLRPIISDARVFTDKIARHPESLGVRGALERRPGIK
jgi:phospholipid/cholesterol/gamma-HCH transport system substrate-binding protein